MAAINNAAGMKVIVGVPAPELLTLVNKKVRQYDIKVAIHNHGPGDKIYPTPARAYEKIKDLRILHKITQDLIFSKR